MPEAKVFHIISSLRRDGRERQLHCKNINKVNFLGFLSNNEYFKALRNADILLMTRNNSKFAHAGFPYKLGEYLATGKPIVATRVAGVDTFLENNKNALLIPPENSNAMFEAIKYFIDNPNEAFSIGQAGFDVFQEHFNTKINCEKFYNFILNH